MGWRGASLRGFKMGEGIFKYAQPLSAITLLF